MADRILVVDDEDIIRESISFILRKEGYSVVEAPNGREAYAKLEKEIFDLVITDIEMPEMRGTELLAKISHAMPQTSVIVITAYGSLETALGALRNGASDYILKPIEFDDLTLKVRRLLEHKKLTLVNQILRRELQGPGDFSRIIGKSPAMEKVFEMIRMVSPTDSTVLITGKSGTGKELVARAILEHSPRKEKPFVIVNCGAIAESLIESELFGHKRGSFTGAIADKVGLFKAADGGTLCLDEVSEMPLQLQVKLLRALEQREITPVGAALPIAIDVRFIASTNRDLRLEVAEGRFREDLFYRLNVVEIHIPSLSERREDIPLLVEHFLAKYRLQMRKSIAGVDNDVMRRLMHHLWRGEIRELENVIERAVIFSQGERITLNDLPDLFQAELEVQIAQEGKSLEEAMNILAKQYIEMVLRKHQFDKEKAAESLKVSLPTLYRRIKELNIVPEQR